MKRINISLLSLIIAALTLFYVLCIGVKTNTAGLLIAVLALLVTALIGFQIAQYIFAEKKMKEITRQAAHDTSMDVICTFKIENTLKAAKQQRSLKRYMSAIDTIFKALEYTLSLKELAVRQYETNASFQLLQDTLLESKDKGGLWILEDKKLYYLSLLQALSSPFLQQCTSLILEAEEHPVKDDGSFWDETYVCPSAPE